MKKSASRVDVSKDREQPVKTTVVIDDNSVNVIGMNAQII